MSMTDRHTEGQCLMGWGVWQYGEFHSIASATTIPGRNSVNNGLTAVRPSTRLIITRLTTHRTPTILLNFRQFPPGPWQDGTARRAAWLQDNWVILVIPWRRWHTNPRIDQSKNSSAATAAIATCSSHIHRQQKTAECNTESTDRIRWFRTSWYVSNMCLWSEPRNNKLMNWQNVIHIP